MDGWIDGDYMLVVFSVQCGSVNFMVMVFCFMVMVISTLHIV